MIAIQLSAEGVFKSDDSDAFSARYIAKFQVYESIETNPILVFFMLLQFDLELFDFWTE